MLPRRVRVDLGAMAMKECSAFPKAPASLEPHHQIVLCHIPDTRWGGSYPSAEVQSVYSTSPADWAIYWRLYRLVSCQIVYEWQNVEFVLLLLVDDWRRCVHKVRCCFIKCRNIHGTHVTANNSTTNNNVFFFCFKFFEIVFDNNY